MTTTSVGPLLFINTTARETNQNTATTTGSHISPSETETDTSILTFKDLLEHSRENKTDRDNTGLSSGLARETADEHETPSKNHLDKVSSEAISRPPEKQIEKDGSRPRTHSIPTVKEAVYSNRFETRKTQRSKSNGIAEALEKREISIQKTDHGTTNHRHVTAIFQEARVDQENGSLETEVRRTRPHAHTVKNQQTSSANPESVLASSKTPGENADSKTNGPTHVENKSGIENKHTHDVTQVDELPESKTPRKNTDSKTNGPTHVESKSGTDNKHTHHVTQVDKLPESKTPRKNAGSKTNGPTHVESKSGTDNKHTHHVTQVDELPESKTPRKNADSKTNGPTHVENKSGTDNKHTHHVTQVDELPESKTPRKNADSNTNSPTHVENKSGTDNKHTHHVTQMDELPESKTPRKNADSKTNGPTHVENKSGTDNKHTHHVTQMDELSESKIPRKNADSKTNGPTHVENKSGTDNKHTHHVTQMDELSESKIPRENAGSKTNSLTHIENKSGTDNKHTHHVSQVDELPEWRDSVEHTRTTRAGANSTRNENHNGRSSLVGGQLREPVSFEKIDTTVTSIGTERQKIRSGDPVTKTELQAITAVREKSDLESVTLKRLAAPRTRDESKQSFSRKKTSYLRGQKSSAKNPTAEITSENKGLTRKQVNSQKAFKIKTVRYSTERNTRGASRGPNLTLPITDRFVESAREESQGVFARKLQLTLNINATHQNHHSTKSLPLNSSTSTDLPQPLSLDKQVASIILKSQAAAKAPASSVNHNAIHTIQEIIAHIQNGLKQFAGDYSSRLSINFESRNLGNVHLYLQEKGGHLQILMQVPNDVVRDRVSDYRQEIMDHMRELGYENVEFDVSTQDKSSQKQEKHAQGNENEENVKLPGESFFAQKHKASAFLETERRVLNIA